MTQEDKDLLLRDLSARLPYRVIIHLVESNEDEELYCLNIPQEGLYTRNLEHNNVTTLSPIECIKPYLRPMSSITEEEKKKFDEVLKSCNNKVFACASNKRRYNFFDAEQEDFMNAYHFDYRGLIEKKLALEASVDMYKID